MFETTQITGKKHPLIGFPFAGEVIFKILVFVTILIKVGLLRMAKKKIKTIRTVKISRIMNVNNAPTYCVLSVHVIKALTRALYVSILLSSFKLGFMLTGTDYYKVVLFDAYPVFYIFDLLQRLNFMMFLLVLIT